MAPIAGWRPNYITDELLKTELKITTDDDDTWIGLCASAASRAVDRHTFRQFGLLAEPVALVCPAQWWPDRRRWAVALPDLMTTTGLVVEVDGAAVTGYRLEPVNAALEGKPWEWLLLPYDTADVPVEPDYDVDVTARFGWADLPDVVAPATLLQAQRFYARRDSIYGVAGSPTMGSEIRLLAKVDPDVGVMLADVVRQVRAG